MPLPVDPAQRPRDDDRWRSVPLAWHRGEVAAGTLLDVHGTGWRGPGALDCEGWGAREVSPPEAARVFADGDREDGAELLRHERAVELARRRRRGFGDALEQLNHLRRALGLGEHLPR